MLRAFSILAAFLLTLATAQAADMKIRDIKVGTGAEAVTGAEVSVHYTGWLMNGKKFDSSVDRGRPFSFTPGAGMVIKGWEKGVLGMKVGGKRQLIIPPEMGYGARGAGKVIPPNATLKFDIELLAVHMPKFKSLDNAGLKQELQKHTMIIDIRRPDEWKATGVVKGSKLLTFFDRRGRVNPKFMQKFQKMVKSATEVVLICRTGNRTGAVSKFLSERAGYTGIRSVAHGITDWIRAGNPVNKTPTLPSDCWLCKN